MPDYLIKTIIPAPDSESSEDFQRERIIRAKNEAQAIAFVVKDTISVDRATIDDAMRLAKIGVEVEQA